MARETKESEFVTRKEEKIPQMYFPFTVLLCIGGSKNNS